MLADRQQAMMEFIQQSNQQLAQTINQSQASAQAAQLQTALQQVGACSAIIRRESLNYRGNCASRSRAKWWWMSVNK